MIEENFLFRKIKEVPQTCVVTCQPWQDIQAVAASLLESGASGAVVCDERIPVGIITDRDFRNVIARRMLSKGALKAEDIMSAPLIRIDEDNYLFEAIYRMSRRNIHHLVITDAEGAFAGVITDTDIMSMHISTPIYFRREIKSCENFVELQKVNTNVKDIVLFAMDAGARTRDIVRLISLFNDSITERAIALLERDKNLKLPEGVAFLALGSEGRQEQTLRTDQDNALVYADGLGDEALAQARVFAKELVDQLNFIGVPYCPGGTMASNPKWAKSLGDWKKSIDRWIATPTPENMVEYGMFQDFRTIHGDNSFEAVLRKYLLEKVQGNSIFMNKVAQNVTRFPPALGFFDRFVLQKKGENKGTMNLKKAGIFAITEGISLLAAEYGCEHGTTWDKIDALKNKNAIDGDDAEEIEMAFTFLLRLRLNVQLRKLSRGKKPTDNVAPSSLTAIEQKRLRISLKGVRQMIKILKDHYRTDMVGG